MASVNNHETRITSLENKKNLSSIGSFKAPEGTSDLTNGLTIGYVYDNGYPCTYGNVINLGGQGMGQILVEWSSSSGAKGGLFFRNQRDTSDANWSAWSRVWTQGEVITNACWNDYAEYFPKGEDTEPGDIVALDTTSAKEQYIKADCNSKRVVGVHSDTYGHLIGGDEISNGDYITENNKKYIPIGLAGRVYVKVKGKVKLGDYIVPSNEKGIGRALNEDIESLKNIVGYVVEADNRTDIRRVKIFITNGDR